MASRRLVVANITLQSSRWDYDEQVKFSGRSFRLVRIGTNGDLKKAEDARREGALGGCPVG